MRPIKFGTMIRLKKKQSPGRHSFSQVPVGTICSVIRQENMPAYDLLVAIDYHLPPEVVSELEGSMVKTYAQERHTMLVERGTWELLND